MDYVIGVQLVDRLTNLPHDAGHLVLRHRLVLLQLFEELPARTHLQDNVDVNGVVEEAVHADDVGVVQEALDLELSDKLLGDLLLEQQPLLDYLQGADEVGLLLLGQEHLPVLARAQILDALEVVDGHLLLLLEGPDWPCGG